MTADVPHEVVVLVLEGAAKGGVRAGRDAHVRTVHAKGSGDDAIVAEAERAAGRGDRVSVVTADRILMGRVERYGATVMSPDLAARRARRREVGTTLALHRRRPARRDHP